MAWMLYLTVVSVLAALAARIPEGVLTMYGRPVRWVWLGALVAPLVVPWIAPRAGATEVAAPPTDAAAPVSMLDPSMLERLATPAGFDVVLERVWIGSTVLALLTLACWFVALAVAANMRSPIRYSSSMRACWVERFCGGSRGSMDRKVSRMGSKSVSGWTVVRTTTRRQGRTNCVRVR